MMGKISKNVDTSAENNGKYDEISVLYFILYSYKVH